MNNSNNTNNPINNPSTTINNTQKPADVFFIIFKETTK
jgi:hypothetical protein